MTARVAILHEWLVTVGGGELVLAELLRIFPGADVFTLVDTMPATERAALGIPPTHTSVLQRIPGIERRYRSMLPLFPLAVRTLDVSAYDIVISNSHAAIKGVRTHERQLHVCYCLSPMRYAWDLREQYLREAGLDRAAKGVAARTVLEGLRRWDRRTSRNVDEFATLSHYIADRIRRSYDRRATVIYPPVDTDYYSPAERDGARRDYYITASRFVPYKRIDLIAEAFSAMPDRKLLVVGDGPEAAKIRRAAGPNVTLVGRVPRDALRDLLRGARAFVFAADEDFGIAPVEAQACGTPVIAFGKGGAVETVRTEPGADRTGVLFAQQTVDSLTEGVKRFEEIEEALSPLACRRNAERFAAERFRREMRAFVNAAYERFAL